MKKTKIILYWVSTLWLCFTMTVGGAFQLLHKPEPVESFTKLGYPLYFLTLLGLWKILGVIALLLPKTPLLKEWAYAGFFFAMSGAAFSHIMIKDSFSETIASIIALLAIGISWYCRPDSKKL